MTLPANLVGNRGIADGEPCYVAPELVTRDADGTLLLIGGRCRTCGARSFPKALVCSNCLSEEIEAVTLAREGTLYSFAAVHAAPQGWHLPYVLGYVDLPDNVRVLAHIAASPEALRVDMPVRLSVGEVGTDASGRALLTYTFTPLG
jgi:uncharacterized OB-fold protein